MAWRTRPTFRLQSRDQCWPLLFHVEPHLTAQEMGKYSVTVLDDQGTHEFPDVAAAQAGSRQQPPHRVELFVRGAGVKLIGLWMVGFGPGQDPAVTVAEITGMDDQTDEIRASIAEFLDVSDPPAVQVTQPAEPGRGWRLIANQPWTVQVVGGVIATLAATAIVALVAILFR